MGRAQSKSAMYTRARGARVLRRSVPPARALESLAVEPLGVELQHVTRWARQEHPALAGGGTGSRIFRSRETAT